MATVSVQDFIAQNHQKKGRVSKLMPFKDDILFLKQNGYSQQQILDFLSQNGLTVGMTTLNFFIRKHNGTSSNVRTAAPKPKQPETAPASQDNTAASPAPKKQTQKGIKKFDWKTRQLTGWFNPFTETQKRNYL